MRTLFIIIGCLLAMGPVVAQDEPATKVDYDLTAETAVGTGDFTAFQLTTNRYHVLATRPNTAYLRGAVNAEHQLGEDWTLSGAVDLIGSVHADHKVYLQQCYANLSWKDFFFEAGAREQKPVLRDELLSSGTWVRRISGQYQTPRVGYRPASISDTVNCWTMTIARTYSSSIPV